MWPLVWTRRRHEQVTCLGWAEGPSPWLHRGQTDDVPAPEASLCGDTGPEGHVDFRQVCMFKEDGLGPNFLRLLVLSLGVRLNDHSEPLTLRTLGIGRLW